MKGKKTQLISEFESSGITNMADVWSWSVNKYGGKRLLGTREVIDEVDVVQPDGKVMKKLDLGEYQWLTYRQADDMVNNFGHGLRAIGMKPGDKVCFLLINKW